jgi:hypothetical protein
MERVFLVESLTGWPDLQAPNAGCGASSLQMRKKQNTRLVRIRSSV